MKNPWIKWAVGLTSVISFASLIGYFQKPDDQINNYNEIVYAKNQISETTDNRQSYNTINPELDWDETWFDDPSSLINTQIITLDDDAIEFNESLLVNISKTENKTIIVSEGKEKVNEPKKTKTRSS